MANDGSSINGSNSGPIHGQVPSSGAAAEPSGKFDGRNVSKVKGEQYIHSDDNLRATGDQPKLGERSVAVHATLQERYLDCEFQHSIAHGLLDSEQLSDELEVYYLNEDGNKIFVDPRGEDCTQDIYDEYVSSMEVLRDNSDSILAKCASALEDAKQQTNLTEAYQKELLSAATPSPIQLSQLLSMANDEAPPIDGIVSELSENIVDPTVGEGLYAGVSEREALSYGEKVVRGASAIINDDESHAPVIDENSEGEHVSEFAKRSDIDALELELEPESETESKSEPEGQVITTPTSSDPQGTDETIISNTLDIRDEELPSTEKETQEKDGSSAAADNEESAGELTDGELSDKKIVGDSEENQTVGGLLILGSSSGAGASLLIDGKESEPAKNRIETANPKKVPKGDAADPKVVSGDKGKDDNELTHPLLSHKESTEEESGSAFENELKIFSDRPVPDSERLDKIFADLSSVPTSQQASKELIEALKVAITSIKQAEAELLQKWPLDVTRSSAKSEVLLTDNPPDGNDLELQKMNCRKECIEKFRKILESLKCNTEDLSLKNSYKDVVNIVDSKIKLYEEDNKDAERENKYIASQLKASCKKDIGIDAGSYNDVSAQLKALSSTHCEESYLSEVVDNINKLGANEKIKDVIQSKLNSGVISSILDTKDDSLTEARSAMLGGVRAARLIQATTQKLLDQAEEKINRFSNTANLSNTNEIRKIKDAYTDAIEQLKMSHWGSNEAGLRERQIYPATRRHVNGVISTALSKLDTMASSYQLANTGGFVSDVKKILEQQLEKPNTVIGQIDKFPRNSTEMDIQAVTNLMRIDPDFCRGVVAAFGSLSGEFMSKGGTGASYQNRSNDAMRMLRINHNLGRALSAPALLQAVVHDVCLPNSRLMSHFISRYGGRDKTRDDSKLRSQKIIEQAAEYLQQEGTAKPLKLQNQQTRDSFAKNVPLYSLGTVTTKNKAKLGSGNELINSFLKNVGEAGVISVPQSTEKHIDTGVKINGEPLLLSGEPLSVDLLGARWVVEPGFFIDDHPDVRIPFEDSDEQHRDWLPLKDSLSGKTAILAMSKKAGCPRPFLYTLGTDKQWQCKPIGASGDPAKDNEEEFEGVLFALTACFDRGNNAQALAARAQTIYRKMQGGDEGYPDAVEKEFNAIKKGSNKWFRNELAVQDLVSFAVQNKEDNQAYDISDITGFESAYDDMRITAIDSPVAFEVNKEKMEKDGSSVSGQGNVVVDISSESRSANFEVFDKPSTYDVMTNHMVKVLREEYKDNQGMQIRINQIAEEIMQYGDVASDPSLHAFRGCIIASDKYNSSDVLDKPRSALNEVIGKSWRHNALLFQEREQKQREIQGVLDKYYDQGEINTKLFDHAVLLFEQNKIPEGMNKDDQSLYIRGMASYLLLENASQIEYQQLQGKTRLLDKLTLLESKRLHMNKAEFELGAKQWNLEMALLAEQQLAIDNQLNEYDSKALDSKTLARLSFECRAKTVLRNNQVDEVNDALDEITSALSNDDGRMRRVSQKGTGWGKSTVLKMLSDHASAQLRDMTTDIGLKRSVMIVAPKSNQAELDITFAQYFRKSGRDYRRLNMSDYTSQRHWWRNETTLDAIHNTLLGLPPRTDAAKREEALGKTNRAPVGASIEDVQVLLQLKSALEKSRDAKDSTALDKLNSISDLFRESMLFCDEWDSALMPPKLDMLNDISKAVNESLKGAGSVSNEDVRNEQATFIMGARRKHLLSATTGSTYLLLQATGKTDVREAQEASNLGIEESNYRALRWINEADILFHDNYDNKKNLNFERDIAQQVVSRIGKEQGILYLDGREEVRGKSSSLADTMGAALRSARKGADTELSTLYYDDDKQIRKVVSEKGMKRHVRMSAIEEKVIRKNGAKGLDSVLTQQESVGTDAPQSADTPMVHVGLLAQPEGRLDFIAQQLGRMRCDKVVKKQPKMLVVTRQELTKLTNMGRGKIAGNALKSWDAMNNARSELISQIGKPETSPVLQKIMHQQLPVKPSELNDDSWDESIEEALSLIEPEWEKEMTLSPQQLDALKAFKKAQFLTQKDTRLVMAEEFGRRDRSDYTVSTERAVQKASKKAVAESLHGDGHNTLIAQVGELSVFRDSLKSKITGVVEAATLEKSRDPAEVGQVVADQFVADTQEKLNAIRRPSTDTNQSLTTLKSSTDGIGHQVNSIVAEQERNIQKSGFIKSIDPSAKNKYTEYDKKLQTLFQKEMKSMMKDQENMKGVLKSVEFSGRPSINKIMVKKINEANSAWNKGEKEKAVDVIAKAKEYMLDEFSHFKFFSGMDPAKKIELGDKISSLISSITGWKAKANAKSAIHTSFEIDEHRVAKFEIGYGAISKWRFFSDSENKLDQRSKNVRNKQESIINPIEESLANLLTANKTIRTTMSEYNKVVKRQEEVEKVDAKIRETVASTFNELKAMLTENVIKKLSSNNNEVIDEVELKEKKLESMMQKPPA